MTTLLETNVLNIIHLPNDIKFPHRELREKNFLKGIKEQGIKEYKVWNGIFIEDNPIKAISQSHKMIVRDAKEKGLSRVFIAEDDFYFTNKGAWEYFLNSIPEEYDVFLSHVYYGKWDENGKMKGPFSSLTLYCVNEKFYDKFLLIREDEHLDLTMNKAWRQARNDSNRDIFTFEYWQSVFC
jgi:hypothetical protein